MFSGSFERKKKFIRAISENMTKKITKETILADILKHPKAEKILAKYNLPCLHCPMAAQEMEKLKIGEVCKMYNINLESLLKELNKG